MKKKVFIAILLIVIAAAGFLLWKHYSYKPGLSFENYDIAGIKLPIPKWPIIETISDNDSGILVLQDEKSGLLVISWETAARPESSDWKKIRDSALDVISSFLKNGAKINPENSEDSVVISGHKAKILNFTLQSSSGGKLGSLLYWYCPENKRIMWLAFAADKEDLTDIGKKELSALNCHSVKTTVLKPVYLKGNIPKNWAENISYPEFAIYTIPDMQEIILIGRGIFTGNPLSTNESFARKKFNEIADYANQKGEVESVTKEDNAPVGHPVFSLKGSMVINKEKTPVLLNVWYCNIRKKAFFIFMYPDPVNKPEIMKVINSLRCHQ